MKCSNCHNEIKDPENTIIVTHGPNTECTLCPACLNVKKFKIVMKKENTSFIFEQYFPIES